MATKETTVSMENRVRRGVDRAIANYEADHDFEESMYRSEIINMALRYVFGMEVEPWEREWLEAYAGLDVAPESVEPAAGPSTSESQPPRESGGNDSGEPQVAATGIAVTEQLESVDFPDGRDREACEAAVAAAREYLRVHGPASMREIVQEVMPDHSIGYDVPDLEPGDRYRGAWWRKVVKPGLEALDDVESPAGGGSDWRYVGE